MKIKQALFTAGYSSFYFDDQQAIKNGAGHDGFIYTGAPVTPGFTSVRQAGECVSVQLILENGAVAVGDCAAVQYSGAGGRDPLFLAENFIPFLNDHIKPLLEGRDVARITQAAARASSMTIGRLAFSLSREQRARVEGEAQAQAIHRFKTRAAEIAKGFGFSGFSLREVAVNSNDQGGFPRPRMMATARPARAKRRILSLTSSGMARSEASLTSEP